MSVSPFFGKWIEYFSSHSNKPTIPATVYAVLASRIEMTLDEFVRAAQAAPRAERAPWPCMNPDCSDYQNLLIGKYTGVSQDFRLFRCPTCCASYSRPWPLMRNPDGSFEHKIRTRNNEWYLRFDTSWRNPKLKWDDLQKLFNLSLGKIGFIAAQRGLQDMPEVKRTLKWARRPKVHPHAERSRQALNNRRDEWRQLSNIANPTGEQLQRIKRLREIILYEDRKWAESVGVRPTPHKKLIKAIRGKSMPSSEIGNH